MTWSANDPATQYKTLFPFLQPSKANSILISSFYDAIRARPASLGSYSTVVATIIGLCALLLTAQGWSLASTAFRKTRTTIQPSDGLCARHRWEDIRGYKLHVCTSIWPNDCHDREHLNGKACYNQTALTAINCWQANASDRFVRKPEQLPLSKSFIQVDYKVVLAFVFMCLSLEDIAHHVTYTTQECIVYLFGVELRLQDLDSGIIVTHLTGSLARTLTKDYVNRLAWGHPPLLEDPPGYSITKANDEARGGWVVALGFDFDGTEHPFLPVYLDSVRHRAKRGEVFWRSMDRVLDIIVHIWSMCFSEDEGSSKQISGNQGY